MHKARRVASEPSEQQQGCKDGTGISLRSCAFTGWAKRGDCDGGLPGLAAHARCCPCLFAALARLLPIYVCLLPSCSIAMQLTCCLLATGEWLHDEIGCCSQPAAGGSLPPPCAAQLTGPHAACCAVSAALTDRLQSTSNSAMGLGT